MPDNCALIKCALIKRAVLNYFHLTYSCTGVDRKLFREVDNFHSIRAIVQA